MVFDPRLHLSELNGSNGFTINGLGGNDRLGQSVSRAGDINGDGIEDFVVGASSASPDGKVQAGTSYVIFGGQDFSRGSLDLANLDGNNGFVVEGAENYDVSGSSVSNAGDFNGDGFDDLAIGASGADAIYIVFGGQDFSRSSLNLADLDITDGFVIEGDTQDFNKSIGGFVSSIGDINNDGLDDIVVGSFNPSSDAILEGYIIYGRSDLDSGRLNLVSLSDSDGFKFTGSQKSTSSEFSASGTGDINGDGIDDLTIGIGTYDSGNYIRSYVAESYVIFGSQDFNAVHLASTDLDGTNGFTIIGLDQPGGGPGGIVNSPGDINGDGVNDILIGDSFGSINIGAGESYIVFGGQDFSSGSLRLAELNGSNGFVIEGVDAYDRSGSAVNGAGDVNGDGIDDVIIGAYAADPNSQRYAGESYVVFGSSNTNRDRLQLADLDGSNGFVIEGSSSGDRSGYAVSDVGDVNGDGIDDVIVGAPDANSSNQPYRYSSAGASYIIFGRASRPPEPTLVIEDNLAVREDTTFVTDAETLDVLDSEGAGLIYSLTGGADQALFNIESSTGELSFNVVPDFENPSDFDGDNIYEVELTVTDTAGLSDRQLLTVDIINVTRGFTPSLNLDELDGSNGFVINGIDENDSSGQIVSQAGDINGDGISDVIISTPYASNAPGDNAIYGESYVVFGRKDRNKSSVNLAELDGSNGFIITRSEDASRFRSVSGAGDINGDGIDDLVVGLTSFIDGDNSRETYVIFGGQDFSSGELDLLTLDGSNGFAIEGAATEFGFGDTVSGAGDVNGDGIDDLVIGAARVSIGSIERAGKSYVVFGGQDFSDGQINLKTLDGSNGFVIDGIDPDGQLGYSVSGAGDLNGDDFDDVILGARNGKSYVIFGRQNFGGGSFDLQELDGRNGIIITGDRSARSVSSAGDFNSDGVDDVIIGSRGISSLPATSYIVFGRKNFSESNLNLLELDTGSGVMLSDESRGSLIASSAGDINGDGIDDVIIGNPSAAKGVDRYDNPNVGKSYVVFGSQNLSTNRLDLSELDGSNGFVAIGSSVADFSGESVSGAGDINGDGISDIIIGAGGGDPNGVLDAGESYVIFGSTSDAPLVSISRVFRITEGTPFVVDVDAEDNLDAEGVGLIYSISNSLDQSLFTIDAVTGELSFITAPTFDNPSDADGDNTYEVAVTVTDSDGLSDTRDLTISITPASFTVVNSNNGDRLLFPDGAGEIVVSSFDIDEGREFGRSERSFDALSILDGAFQGDYSTTRDFLDLTFAIENDFDSSTDALRDGDALIFNFGNGDELRLEDVFGRDGLTVERFEANGGDIFTPDAVL